MTDEQDTDVTDPNPTETDGETVDNSDLQETEPEATAAPDPEPEEPTGPESVKETLNRVYKNELAKKQESGEDLNVSKADESQEPSDDGSEGIPPEEPAVPSSESVEAPSSLTADEREKYATLPPDVKAFVSDVLFRRDEDLKRHLHQKSQELSQAKQPYAELDEIVAPYQNDWAKDGITVSDKVRQWTAIEDSLNNNLVGTLDWIAQRHGTTLQQVFQHGVQNGYQPPSPEIVALQQQIQGLQGAFEQQNQEQNELAVQQIERKVQMFAEAKGDDGQLQYPYFKELYQEIVPLIEIFAEQNPQATDEQIIFSAYEKALWSNPETRRLMLDKQEAARFKEEERRRQESIAKADNASSSITAGPVTPQKPRTPGTLKDTIRDAVRQQMQ